MALLTIEGLNAYYGHVQVLHGLSMHIDQGELVAVIGPNGAGKTTLLRALSRTIRTAGRMTFDGDDLSKMNPRQAVEGGVVHCPEGRQLFGDMTVEDNLELGAFLRSDSRAIKDDLGRVFDLFPVLKERRRQRAGTMSGGEQQMLAIGRSLMCKPRLLILDEPSFGIAPLIVERIFEIIRQLNRDGLTTLVVEQNVAVALESSGRTYVLEGGSIVHQGESAQLESDQEIQKAYLGL